MKAIIHFINVNFELLVAINFIILAAYLVIIFFLNFHERSIAKYLYTKTKALIYGSLVIGQIFVIGASIYLYWVNYHKPIDELFLKYDIIDNTSWVRNNTKIYFIDRKDLLSINANGENQEYIYEADEAIREYHFSPDGKHFLIITDNDLFLFNREDKLPIVIHSLGGAAYEQELKGVIGGLRWAPDSQKFCYEVSRWSKVSSQDNLFVYDISSKQKKSIKSPTRKVSHLYWDNKAQNLYYLRHESGDSSNFKNVKVFRIPLTTLKPEYVDDIPFDKAQVPIESLNLRNIDLFTEGDKIAFGRTKQRDQLISKNGQKVGIDASDYFFFVPERWNQVRLFKVDRTEEDGEFPHYQYKGGPLNISHIRWLPGGHYVIMEHRELGILILDPKINRIGQLLGKRGRDYGWYSDVWLKPKKLKGEEPEPEKVKHDPWPMR